MALQSHQPQLCTAVVQKNHPSCGGPERLFVSTVLCPPSPGHNHSICLLQMLVSAAHVCPWKSRRSLSAASWNPMVMRWWQTQVVSPIVSLIQTFRLQFKGSCIPASYSLKLAYLVSKLWSHPLWGMLCAVLREQTWMSLLLVFEGFFPPALLLPSVSLANSSTCQMMVSLPPCCKHPLPSWLWAGISPSCFLLTLASLPTKIEANDMWGHEPLFFSLPQLP